MTTRIPIPLINPTESPKYMVLAATTITLREINVGETVRERNLFHIGCDT